MLTELFLNSCFSLCLNKNTKIKKNKIIYRDILEILNFFKLKQKNEIPINLQNKIECLTTICELKLQNKTDDNIIDSILFGEKFKSLIDFINIKRNEEISDTILYDHIKQIRERKKFNIIISNYDNLSSFLDIVKSGNYNSIDKIVHDYEKIIKEANSNLLESNRNIGLQSSSSLDLMDDDYNHVINMIKQKYDKKNTIHTGFTVFDQNVFDQGGFEKTRLYTFGGGSGSGKSTLMLNFINNDITKPKDQNSNNNSFVYVYITLENQVDESFLRLYQMMFRRDTTQTLRDINTNGDDFVKKQIMEKLKQSGYNLVFKYFPKHSISCTDIMLCLDEIIDKYGKDSIRGLYVDYLDLLRSDIQSDLYRLELGFITAELKDVAVKYNIPVITATQLGREVYKVKDSSSLSVAMVSEGIKKVENSDFICIMAQDQNEDTKIYMKIGKNRCGKNNISINFKVNFNHYKFLIGTKTANSKKSDATTDQQMEFQSLDNDGKLVSKQISSYGGGAEYSKDRPIDNDV